MPLAYLVDENLRGPLTTALIRHNALGIYPVDFLRVGDLADLPLASVDPDILLWAENRNRTLVSEDKNTLPRHLADHIRAGHHSPGIFLVPITSTIPGVVSFLVAAAYASDPGEWQDRIEYLS